MTVSATGPSIPQIGKRVPFSRMRRAIASSMSASAAIPQFNIERLVDLSNADSVRRSLSTSDSRISLVDMLIAATTKALEQHPRLNAWVKDEEILEFSDINIALAIAIDDGLIAPALIGCQSMSLQAIGDERRRLTSAAAAGTITLPELNLGTFSISNLGPLGVDRFQALVVPPQVGILAVGKSNIGGQVSLTLSCDHRAIDGAPAAEFLSTLSEILEGSDSWTD